MAKTVEVIYEGNVLKPIEPIKGIKEHERVLVILCPQSYQERSA